MVFITPTIVHSSEDTEILLRQELERRRTRLKDELDALIGEKTGVQGASSPAEGQGKAVETKPADAPKEG
jgi:hypothetical protein